MTVQPSGEAREPMEHGQAPAGAVRAGWGRWGKRWLAASTPAQRAHLASLAPLLRRSARQRERRQQAANNMNLALGEPWARARRLARRWQRSDTAFDLAMAHMACAPRRRVKAEIDSARLHNREALTLVDREVAGPVILATIHMANYMHAIAHLAGASAKIEEVVLLRRLPWSEREAAIFENLHYQGVRYQVVRHDDPDLMARLLRAMGPRTALVVPYDLPPDYGAARPVRLLGVPCRLPYGLALLARRGKATVLPFVAGWQGAGRLDITLSAPLTGLPTARFPRAPKPEKLMPALADQASAWIRANPAQWLMWHNFGRYVDAAAVGGAP